MNSETIIKVGMKGREDCEPAFSKSLICICYRHMSLGFGGSELLISSDMHLPDLLSNQARIIITSPSLSDEPQLASVCTLISDKLCFINAL